MIQFYYKYNKNKKTQVLSLSLESAKSCHPANIQKVVSPETCMVQGKTEIFLAQLEFFDISKKILFGVS